MVQLLISCLSSLILIQRKHPCSILFLFSFQNLFLSHRYYDSIYQFMKKFQTTKLFDGFSIAYRQWKAQNTHCRFIHGYAISFRIWFEGELDQRDWVWDFGGMKRADGQINGMKPREFFNWLFDHTTIIAEDDPYLPYFQQMDKDGIIQLRVLPAIGCERFAEYLYKVMNQFIKQETEGKIKVSKVEFFETDKNCAIYQQL